MVFEGSCFTSGMRMVYFWGCGGMVWSDSCGSWTRLVASVGVLLAWRGNGLWRGFRGLVGNVYGLVDDWLRCEGVAAVMPFILGCFVLFMLAYSSK